MLTAVDRGVCGAATGDDGGIVRMRKLTALVRRRHKLRQPVPTDSSDLASVPSCWQGFFLIGLAQRCIPVL